MQREEIIQICEREVLEIATAQFGTSKDVLRIFPDYEGAASTDIFRHISNISSRPPMENTHRLGA